MARMNWDRKRRYDRVHREPRAQPDQIRRLQELTGLPRSAFRDASQDMCAQLIEYHSRKPATPRPNTQCPIVPRIQDPSDTDSYDTATVTIVPRTDSRQTARDSSLLEANLVTILSQATRAVKAKESVRIISSQGRRVSKREVNSVLYRLERKGILTRNPDFTWQI